MFNIGVVFSSGVLLPVCGEQPILMQQLGCLRINIGSLCPITISCNPSLVQEALLDDKRWAAGTLCLQLFVDFIYIIFIYVCFRSFHCIMSHTTHQMSLYQMSFPAFPIQIPLPSLALLNLPIQELYPYLFILSYFHFLKRSACLL